MISSAESVFNKGSLLALGSFKEGFCPAQRTRLLSMLRNSHDEAVTPADSEHGHRCAYPLNALKRDAIAAGVMAIHRQGIFVMYERGGNEDSICCHRTVVRAGNTWLEVGACP